MGIEMELLVYITVPNEEEASDIARHLVASRLAAGVNICGPARAIYRWKGEVRDTPQWLLFIQTKSHLYNKLEEIVVARHSHLVPCIVAMPLQYGHAPFMDWIAESCCPQENECE